MYDPVTGGAGEPSRSGREIHGYDLLDRLEQEAAERVTNPRAGSAYDQFWLGEESSHLLG